MVITPPARAPLLIEIKSTEEVSERHLKNLKNFRDDYKDSEFFLLSNDPKDRIVDGIQVLHWQTGMKKIFA